MGVYCRLEMMTKWSYYAGMKQHGLPNAALLGHFWDRIERGSLQPLKLTLTRRPGTPLGNLSSWHCVQTIIKKTRVNYGGMDICLHIFAHKHLISSLAATNLLIKDVTQFRPVLPVDFHQLALDHHQLET